MSEVLNIREGHAADAPIIARLSIRESCRHIRADCSADGFRLLLVELAARKVEERMRGGNFRYWVAGTSDEIRGVCAMRDGTHLYHLFVASERHGQGIGRRLWETARNDSLARSPSLEGFTVNASSFARPFYLRLGFRASGDALPRNGILSWPMALQPA